MSEIITKFISEDPYSEQIFVRSEAIQDYFRRKLPGHDITIEESDIPVFVDCGGNLEEIICPGCGSTIDFDWWGGMVEEKCQENVSDLFVYMPCCQKKISLNDLQYDMPCGFASAEIDIEDDIDLSDDDLAELNSIAGETLCVIKAHY